MDLFIYSLIFIILSSLIGIYVSRNVRTAEGFAVASRSLPLPIVTATVFATWFGAESILGVPEAFMEHGLIGTISDPIGAFLCLIILGLFFAKPFYQMDTLTICNFYGERYSKTTEILLALAIAFSYTGWIGAQFLALGNFYP